MHKRMNTFLVVVVKASMMLVFKTSNGKLIPTPRTSLSQEDLSEDAVYEICLGTGT